MYVSLTNQLFDFIYFILFSKNILAIFIFIPNISIHLKKKRFFFLNFNHFRKFFFCHGNVNEWFKTFSALQE